MTQPTFENLASILQGHETQGSSLSATFKCPTSGVETTATSSIQKSQGLGADAARTAKKGLWSSLRRSVSRAITDALGSGTAGRVARGVAEGAMKNAQTKQTFSKAEVEAAVLEAFQSVQAKFRWDEASNAWQGVSEPATAFDKRLADAAVTETYDQGVLARTLIEISAADGNISDEERGFIGGFLDPAIGTVDDLAKRGPLTAAELEETSASARETIVMLAWACTMCDGELDASEAERLKQIASGLAVDSERTAALQADAQQFLFEQTLTGVYASGSRDDSAWNDAIAAAEKMGIETHAAEKIDAGYRKRNGLI